MYKNLNRTEEIIAKLKREGKIRMMDTPEDTAKIEAMNKYMEEVRRDYIFKNAMSERSASRVILNS